MHASVTINNHGVTSKESTIQTETKKTNQTKEFNQAKGSTLAKLNKLKTPELTEVKTPGAAEVKTPGAAEVKTSETTSIKTSGFSLLSDQIFQELNHFIKISFNGFPYFQYHHFVINDEDKEINDIIDHKLRALEQDIITNYIIPSSAITSDFTSIKTSESTSESTSEAIYAKYNTPYNITVIKRMLEYSMPGYGYPAVQQRLENYEIFSNGIAGMLLYAFSVAKANLKETYKEISRQEQSRYTPVSSASSSSSSSKSSSNPLNMYDGSDLKPQHWTKEEMEDIERSFEELMGPIRAKKQQEEIEEQRKEEERKRIEEEKKQRKEEQEKQRVLQREEDKIRIQNGDIKPLLYDIKSKNYTANGFLMSDLMSYSWKESDRGDPVFFPDREAETREFLNMNFSDLFIPDLIKLNDVYRKEFTQDIYNHVIPRVVRKMQNDYLTKPMNRHFHYKDGPQGGFIHDTAFEICEDGKTQSVASFDKYYRRTVDTEWLTKFDGLNQKCFYYKKGEEYKENGEEYRESICKGCSECQYFSDCLKYAEESRNSKESRESREESEEVKEENKEVKEENRNFHHKIKYFTDEQMWGIWNDEIKRYEFPRDWLFIDLNWKKCHKNCDDNKWILGMDISEAEDVYVEDEVEDEDEANDEANREKIEDVEDILSPEDLAAILLGEVPEGIDML